MAKDRDDEEVVDQEDFKDSEMPDEADVEEGEEESGSFPCPYCGADVYEDAIRCPKCNRYVSREEARGRHPAQWIVLIILLALGALAAWALLK